MSHLVLWDIGGLEFNTPWIHTCSHSIYIIICIYCTYMYECMYRYIRSILINDPLSFTKFLLWITLLYLPFIGLPDLLFITYFLVI